MENEQSEPDPVEGPTENETINNVEPMNAPTEEQPNPPAEGDSTKGNVALNVDENVIIPPIEAPEEHIVDGTSPKEDVTNEIDENPTMKDIEVVDVVLDTDDDFKSAEDTSTMEAKSKSQLKIISESDAEADAEGKELKQLTLEQIEEIEKQKKRQKRLESREQQKKVREGLKQDQDDQFEPEKDKLKLLKHKPPELDEGFEMRKTLLLSGTYDDAILRELQEAETSDDSISIISDEKQFVRPCAVSIKTEFLNTFESLPEISDLSSDFSEEARELEIEEQEEEIVIDLDVVGKFVDPLTGGSIQSTCVDDVEEQEPPEHEDLPEEEKWDSEDELDMMVADRFDIDEPPKETVDEDIIDQLFELHKSLVHLSVHEETPTIIRDSPAIVMGFLQELLNNVVHSVEYKDKQEILEGNLDKLKLWNKLRDLTIQYLVGNDKNEFLHSKVIEYYKRLKAFRPISKRNRDLEIHEYRRYIESLAQVDHFRKIAAATKMQTSKLMASIHMDLQYTVNLQNICEERIENIVMNALCQQRDRGWLTSMVEKELKRMQNMRNEISNVRLVLITHKHTFARIDERKKKLEQIREGLTMTVFLSTQIEVDKLSKIAEETEGNLKKARSLLNYEYNMMAHIRERTQILQTKLVKSKQVLAEKEMKQNALREEIFSNTLAHALLKKQKEELVYQGGLLFKPSLMYDYDATLNKVSEQRDRIQSLKNTLRKLEERINRLENKMLKA